MLSDAVSLSQVRHRHFMGCAVPEGDAQASVRALSRMREGGAATPDYAGYTRTHSLKRLDCAFRELLRVALLAKA